MKQIFRIAKIELKQLFYSPIAWLVFFFFIVQTGIDFTERINRMFYIKEENFKVGGITGNFFVSFIYYVQGKLLIYIPLLTMGLMVRERSSGTMRLLLSSPLRSIEIVVGKYLSMLAIGAMFILLLSGAIMIANTTTLHLDIKVLVSGLIGTYLLICAYAAIGLFISNLTVYQVVAILGTYGIFQLLDLMRDVWQDKDFFREITWFMALSGRSLNMAAGLITTEDLFYFVLIVILFLGFVVISLESARKGISGLKKAFRYVGFTIVILLLGYCTTRPLYIGYFDMTAVKGYTLTKKSQDVVKKLKEPLSVHMYDNILDRLAGIGYPESTIGNRKLFANYQQYLPLIKFSTVYYYDTCPNPAVFNKVNRGKKLEELVKLSLDNTSFRPDPLLRPEEMKRQLDLADEDHLLVMQLRSGNKATFLRYFNDMFLFPGEDEITAAIKRLSDSVQTIAFVRGHGERDINKDLDNRSYKFAVKENTYRYSLKNYGFNISQLDLSAGEIPDSISILVIADPSRPFTPEELRKVHAYIEKGRHLVVMGETGNQALLNDIVAPAGVRFLPGQLKQIHKDYAPTYICAKLTPDALLQDPLLYTSDAEAGLKVDMDGAVGLSFQDTAGFVMKPILKADSSITAMALTRHVSGKEQRVMILGDADFMNNEVIQSWYPGGGGGAEIRANFDFYTASFHWLSGNVYPMYAGATRPTPQDNTILLTFEGARRISFGVKWLLPAIILLAGSLILLRRKRK